MSQSIFKDPFITSNPTLLPGSVGNGTLTINKLTHFTVTQDYTAVCTAVAPFTVFQVVGSLDGAVGVAIVGQEFHDPDLKVFLTINQGPTQFEIGDQFNFSVENGTDLMQSNLDTYDHLPQKNFSAGVLGTNSGDDNLRFSSDARLAKLVLQDLQFTSMLADELGNEIQVVYANTPSFEKARLTIQDLQFEADAAGSAGNGISVEYEDWTPGQKASSSLGDVAYEADNVGAAGNAITVEYTGGAPTSTPVVSVLGSAITVQIQSGVTTALQVRQAVNAHPAAGALVDALLTGDSSAIQVVGGPVTLTGGIDPIGQAGSEVVSVVGQAIKVKLQGGVSTAAQVKAAVDAHGGASSLVNVTVVGTAGNAQAAPVAIQNLAGGTDSVGGPGFEVVTVVGTKIIVGFQSGVNTAQDIRDALLAVPAVNALVTVAITGTPADAQIAPAAGFLSGGAPTDHFAFNCNELSLPDAFYEGSGGLLLRQLGIQGSLFVRNAARFKSTVLLDDLNAAGNRSGAAIPNPQRTINELIQNGTVFAHTQQGTRVRWNAPNLYFSSALLIEFPETGIVNRVLPSYSPLALLDGQSAWVTVDRTSSANLAPSVGTVVPHGVDTFRLASRFGSFVILWDGTVIGENQLARIGQGIDLTNQVMALLEDGGTISHSELVIGEIAWDSALHIRPLGSSVLITIPADTITLADDEVAYITLDDPMVTATKGIQVAARSLIDLGRPDTFWIFHRTGSKVIVRNGSSLVPGEERTIGEPISADVYAYMGSAGETDNDPDFTGADGLATAPHYIVDGDNLTKAITKLDDAVFTFVDRIRQNFNAKFLMGGLWNWNGGTSTLTWDSDAYVRIPGLTDARNTILAGNVVLPNALSVAYVEVNRTAGAATNLTVLVADADALVMTDDTLVIARRAGSDVVVGNSFLLSDGVTKAFDSGMSEQNKAFIGLSGEADEEPAYSGEHYIADGDSLLTAVDKLDNALDSAVTDLTQAISDEAQARSDADGTLQGNIDDEAQARADDDGHIRAFVGMDANTDETPDYGAQGAALRAITENATLEAGIASLDREIDRFFGQLQLRAQAPATTTVLLSGANRTLLDSTDLSQEMNGLVLDFGGALIDFASGTITKPNSDPLGNNFAPSVVPNGQYLWYSVMLVPDVIGSDNTISAKVTVTPALAAGASLAVAPKASYPAIPGAKKIGQIAVLGTSTGIDVVPQSFVKQFGVGGGGGGGTGSGDASDLLTSLKSWWNDTFFEFMTDNVFGVRGEDRVDSATATINNTTSPVTYKFSNIGDEVVSIDMIGAAFKARGTVLSEIELAAAWSVGKEDLLATYEAAIDGATFEPITMERIGESNTWRGRLAEFNPANASLFDSGAQTGQVVLYNAQQILAGRFDLAAASVVTKLSANLCRISTVSGNYRLLLLANNAGTPGAVLAQSAWTAASSVSLGVFTDYELPIIGEPLPLIAGTYFVAVEVDAAYQSSYVPGMNYLMQGALTVASYADDRSYNGTTWSVIGSNLRLVHALIGYTLDLRIRITGGTVDAELEGYGVCYGNLSGAVLSEGGSGGGSAGVGGSFVEFDNNGDAPAALDQYEYSQKVFFFGAGQGQKLNAMIQVPASYSIGSPIKLIASAYSPSASGTVQFKATSTLILSGVSAVDSVANQSTATKNQTLLVAKQLLKYELALTDLTGKINGIAVNPGDEILVTFERDTDTDVADVRVRRKAEVTFV